MSQRALITVLFVILAGVFTITVNADNITVEVGKDGLNFVPQKISVSNGDEVIFKFVNPNIMHNVIESDSEASCTKSTKSDAFASASVLKSDFTVKINQDEGVLYYYCSVGKHCSVGMWGVINIQAANNTSSKSGAAESSSTSITLATSIVLLSSLFMAMFMV